MKFNNWEQKISPGLRNHVSGASPGLTSRIIIELTGRKPGQIENIINSNQGRLLGEIKLFPALVASVPACCIKELAFSRVTRKLWHDATVKGCLNVAVPAVGSSYVQELGYTGAGVVVAIIDTGIASHPDFIGPVNRVAAWQDLINGESSIYDDNGHGTHVAGIIAGNGRNSRGRFKGMAPEAELVCIKALDAQGDGSISSIINAIEWCIANRKKYAIKVLNLSIGSATQGSFFRDPLCRTTTAAWRNEIFVCAAAGNEGPGKQSINSPGINPVIITVGNLNDQETITDSDDQLNETSSRGPTIDAIAKPDILAPGTEITSTWLNGRYKSLSGTSMATPMVSGAAAQLLQKWPGLKPKVLKRLLMKNARNIGLKKYLQGAGVLDLKKIFTQETVNTRQAAGMNIKNLVTAILGNDRVKEIIMYHIVKMTLERTGKEAAFFKGKRDQLIMDFVNTMVEERLRRS